MTMQIPREPPVNVSSGYDENKRARVSKWVSNVKIDNRTVASGMAELDISIPEGEISIESNRSRTNLPNNGKNVDQNDMKRLNCPHRDCIARFDSLELLRQHKEDEHDYCRFHDLDFENFDAHLVHKVESQAHITCPACGLDFRSTGGRERHMLVSHPKDQRCECPGCENVYTRASALMHHIENNLCNNITWAQFMKIHMKNSLLAGHGEELANRVSDSTEDASPNGDSESEFPPLRSTATWLTADSRKEGSKAEEIPLAIPTEPKFGYNINVSTLGDTESENKYARHDKQKNIYGSQEVRNIENKEPATTYLVDDEIREQVNTKALLPLTHLPIDRQSRMKRLGRMVWGADALKRIQEIIEPKDTPDDLNPFSNRFNIEAFKSFDKYSCPKSNCHKLFNSGRDLTAHLQSPAHHSWDARCPQCFAVFKGAAPLVNHMESPSFRCRIKESEYFGDALEVATSGFVCYEKKGREHVFKGQEPFVE